MARYRSVTAAAVLATAVMLMPGVPALAADATAHLVAAVRSQGGFVEIGPYRALFMGALQGTIYVETGPDDLDGSTMVCPVSFVTEGHRPGLHRRGLLHDRPRRGAQSLCALDLCGNGVAGLPGPVHPHRGHRPLRGDQWRRRAAGSSGPDGVSRCLRERGGRRDRPGPPDRHRVADPAEPALSPALSPPSHSWSRSNRLGAEGGGLAPRKDGEPFRVRTSGNPGWPA